MSGEQHLQELPDRHAELLRVFGFLVEKRSLSSSDDMTGCTSFIQRKLQCGYNRAANLLAELVTLGWITDADRNGARCLLRTSQQPAIAQGE